MPFPANPPPNFQLLPALLSAALAEVFGMSVYAVGSAPITTPRPRRGRVTGRTCLYPETSSSFRIRLGH